MTSTQPLVHGGADPHAVYSFRRFGSVAWWTDRCGGESEGSYATCNLAMHVGDATDVVASNRERVAAVLGTGPAGEWVTLDQVHGTDVARVVHHHESPPVADAAVTEARGIALVVMTADCAPVALFSPHGVGVVHAGWSGLLHGVIGEAVTALTELGGGPVHAVLGPCIHPGGYEFGADDLDQFVSRFGPAARAATTWDAPALDVPAVVRLELERAGVSEFHDSLICTHASAHCFSHRRDGITGRQALIAMREP